MATATISAAHASRVTTGTFSKARALHVVCGGCTRAFRAEPRPMTIRGKQVGHTATCPTCATTNIA